MGSLSSSSTLTQVQNQYDDNASYYGDNNLSKAKLFEEAVVILIRRVPSSITEAGSSVSERSLREDLKHVRDFINRIDTTSRRSGPSVTKIGFRDVRNV